MAAANVLSYRVLWFERHGEDLRRPARIRKGRGLRLDP